jgi:hypothetical protein
MQKREFAFGEFPFLHEKTAFLSERGLFVLALSIFTRRRTIVFAVKKRPGGAF